MSFLTGTNVELIYTNTNTGTAKASFTSEVQINDTAGMGVQARINPDFWLPNATSDGKGIRITARGIFSAAAATTPTYTITIRAGTPGSTASCILLGSQALTTTSGATSQPFELLGDIYVSVVGAPGANSQIIGMGMIKSPGLNTGSPASYMAPLGAGGWTNVTASNFDTTISNYINFNVACSASSASNTITLQSLQVYGLN